MKKLLITCLFLLFISLCTSAQSSGSLAKKKYAENERIIAKESKRIVNTEIVVNEKTGAKKIITYDSNNSIVKITYHKTYRKLGFSGQKIELYDESGKLILVHNKFGS